MKTSKYTILTRIFVLGTLFLTLFFFLPKCESINANEKYDDISSPEMISRVTSVSEEILL